MEAEGEGPSMLDRLQLLESFVVRRGAWIILTGAALYAVFAGFELGFGQLRSPGPGMWPVIIGFPTLILAALLIFIAPILGSVDSGDEAGTGTMNERAWAWGCVLLTAGLAAVIPLVGLYAGVFLYGLLVARFIGGTAWRWSALIGASIVLLCYLAFDVFLAVRVPGPSIIWSS